MKKLVTLLSFACAIAIAPLTALAETFTVGNLEIENPVARATLPGAPVSGGYMVIRNTGTTPDRLLTASVDFAGKTEIHEMAMDNDIMKMRELESGLEIPAGAEVVLKPGGYHVMFMMLKEPLDEGETRKATLVFEKAGAVDVILTVHSIKTMKKMDHSGHSN